MLIFNMGRSINVIGALINFTQIILRIKRIWIMPFVNCLNRQELFEAFQRELPPTSVRDEPWENYMGTVKQENGLIVQVDEENQVCVVVELLSQYNEKNPLDKLALRAAAGCFEDAGFMSCFFPPSLHEQQYNRSFSSSPGASADIILLFSKKFQHIELIGQIKPQFDENLNHPLLKRPMSLVSVSAGVQFNELAIKLLDDYNLSLISAPVLRYITVVGAAGNGVPGAGLLPGICEFIESMRICDNEGKIRILDARNSDFKTLRGAHAGLLGIVLSINLIVTQAFQLEEKVGYYDNVIKFLNELPDLLESDYFSLTHIPTYDSSRGCPRWQVRRWSYTDKPHARRHSRKNELELQLFAQEIGKRLSDITQFFLMDESITALIPLLMRIIATLKASGRGIYTTIDDESLISHYQISVPKDRREVGIFIPVKMAEIIESLSKIIIKIDELLINAAKLNQFPCTDAIYIRLIKGTNGGLSTTVTEEDELILALDIVTHTQAPGIDVFEDHLLNFLDDEKLKPRFHLGKNMPKRIQSYYSFLDAEVLQETIQALERWHGGKEPLLSSLFVTPYFKKMLFNPLPPNLHHSIVAASSVARKEKDSQDFLNTLKITLSNPKLPAEALGLKEKIMHVLAVQQSSEKEIKGMCVMM